MTSFAFINQFINDNQLSDSFFAQANDYYIPLADKLFNISSLHERANHSPFYLGINGAQGSGKSTLTLFLSRYLQQEYSLKVANISLDDFYLSQRQRQQLAVDVHPLFETRGVPGTHDLGLLQDTLNRARQNKSSIALPRFDKATDNPLDSKLWPKINLPVDIVILEGWCWGVSPQTQEQLVNPLNQLEQQRDSELTWRKYVNRQLKEYYQPLYEMMDHWLMLKAPSFDCVANWRWQQEQHLALSVPNSKQSQLMTKKQVFDFVQFFQRLTEQGLKTLPEKCDDVLLLDSSRNILEWQQR